VSLQTQKAPVMYTLDANGELSAIWLLTDTEAARYPAPLLPPTPAPAQPNPPEAEVDEPKQQKDQ